MLTADELAAMRETTATALPDTAVIQGTTYVSDGGGGGTTTWSASGTVACRIAPIISTGQGEGVEGGQLAADAEYIVTLPFDAGVDVEDRLSIGSEIYNVTSVRDRSWNTSTRVEVKKQI